MNEWIKKKKNLSKWKAQRQQDLEALIFQKLEMCWPHSATNITLAMSPWFPVSPSSNWVWGTAEEIGRLNWKSSFPKNHHFIFSLFSPPEEGYCQSNLALAHCYSPMPISPYPKAHDWGKTNSVWLISGNHRAPWHSDLIPEMIRLFCG